MNERDYLIGEAMALSTGVFMVTTIMSVFLLYHLPIDIGFMLATTFVGFVTFFFGLYFHMKRRIWVLENEALIREHREDKPQ